MKLLGNKDLKLLNKVFNDLSLSEVEKEYLFQRAIHADTIRSSTFDRKDEFGFIQIGIDRIIDLRLCVRGVRNFDAGYYVKKGTPLYRIEYIEMVFNTVPFCGFES